MRREMNGRFRTVFLDLRVPDQTVVVKKELSHRAKLSIYWSVYVLTLSRARELWAATEPDLRLVLGLLCHVFIMSQLLDDANYWCVNKLK